MTVVAWVLIVWTGYHTGYYAVPGVASEQACHDLYRKIAEKNYNRTAPGLGDKHECISYEKQ